MSVLGRHRLVFLLSCWGDLGPALVWPLGERGDVITSDAQQPMLTKLYELRSLSKTCSGKAFLHERESMSCTVSRAFVEGEFLYARQAISLGSSLHV